VNELEDNLLHCSQISEGFSRKSSELDDLFLMKQNLFQSTQTKSQNFDQNLSDLKETLHCWEAEMKVNNWSLMELD
jgi:hypothetical protein